MKMSQVTSRDRTANHRQRRKRGRFYGPSRYVQSECLRELTDHKLRLVTAIERRRHEVMALTGSTVGVGYDR